MRTPSVRPGLFSAARIRFSKSAAIRGRPSCFPSLLARARPARTRSLNHRALELGKDTHHLKHGLTGWRACVEALRFEEQVDPCGVQFAQKAN